MIDEIHATMAGHEDGIVNRRSILIRLLHDQSGASAVEYGLLIGLVSMVIIVALQSLALGIDSVWDTANNNITVAVGGSSS